MDRLVNVERSGSTAILTIINPPVNALSRELSAALLEAFQAQEAERIIITATGNIFVAGADIREIQKITTGELQPDMQYLNHLLDFIERSGKLVVMAINGSAFGIGLELAMAGHYRILFDKSQVALPEVKLGLIPGAGGTQRLPRLAGPEAALRLCVTGEAISAREALTLGIVDELSSDNLMDRAKAVTSGRRTDQLKCQGNANFEAWLQKAPPRQRSPQRAVEAIKAALSATSFEDGLAMESDLFRQALLDPQARAMVYLFFAEREIGKIPGISKDTQPATIEKVSKIGDEIELEAAGKCLLKPSPEDLNGRTMEVRQQDGMKPETLLAALQYARKQGRLAIVTRGDQWIGRPDLSGPEAQEFVRKGRVLRGSDIDVLMVRGYGYPEELGGPLHAYSTTPNQISESLLEPLK